MLLGTAIALKSKNETVYVEYHRCDKCGAQYKLYLKSTGSVEDAFQAIAKMLGNKEDEQDLCFECQNEVLGNQVMLPLRV